MKFQGNKTSKFAKFRQGDESHFDIEQRLFNTLGFYAGLMGLGAAGINLLIKAPIALTISASIFAVISFITFYISRFTDNFKLGKWIFTFIVFAMFNYFFFINNGSRGPILYLYMVLYLFLLFIWDGKTKVFFTILFFSNVTVFFIIELKYPDLIPSYPDEKSRLLDLYFSYYMFAVIIGSILHWVKKGYKREKTRAEKSDRLKSTFLSNMSHEIRSPMNAILGFSQLLQKKVNEESRERYINIIQANSKDLLRLIEDIIDISTIEAGKLVINAEEVNLKELFFELNSELSQNLKKYSGKNIEIVEECYPDGLVIVGDFTRLKQILNNFISNAFKYTERGYIRIGYQKENEHLRFFVSDTGSGIRKELQGEIFERFKKQETEASKKIQAGKGIGLSISKDLVELMGGQIGFESEFGRGSTFYFTLPLVLPANTLQKDKHEIEPDNWETINFEGIRILVVDDDDVNSDYLKNALESKGAELFFAVSGEEAVKEVQEINDLNLVLLDIMMPGMDGYQATRLIKMHNPDLPIIAQTALAMEGDEKRIREAGCNDYLSKPIALNDLYSTISNYL